MRCVTNKMHSGIPRALQNDLVPHLCKKNCSNNLLQQQTKCLKEIKQNDKF